MERDSNHNLSHLLEKEHLVYFKKEVGVENVYRYGESYRSGKRF